MVEILCSKSSITADTAFRKFYPAGGAQIATHTRSTSEKPNQNPTRPSRQSNHRIQKYFRGPPLKVDPERSRPAPRRTQGCGDGCKRLGTRKCDWGCRYCRRIEDKYAMRGSSRRVEERGVRRMGFRDGEHTSLPRFESTGFGRILLLLAIQ